MTSTDSLHLMLDRVADTFTERELRQLPALSSENAPRNTVPTLLWPDHAHLIPKRCPREHCWSADIRVEEPVGARILGEAVCGMCTQVLVHLKGRPLYARPASAPPYEPPKRGRPPSGRSPSGRAKTPREAQAEYRQRAARATPESRPCADCTERPARYGAQRCTPCRARYLEATLCHKRLLRAMEVGVPMRANQLQEMLGIRNDSLRHVIRRARASGARIVSVKHGWYRLEAAP